MMIEPRCQGDGLGPLVMIMIWYGPYLETWTYRVTPNHSEQVTTWWQGCCPVSRCQGDALGAGDPQVQSCVRHLLPTWLARINRAPLLDGDDCADMYIVYTLLICGQRLAGISDHWPCNWQLISILIMLLGRMWCQFCQGRNHHQRH